MSCVWRKFSAALLQVFSAAALSAGLVSQAMADGSANMLPSMSALGAEVSSASETASENPLAGERQLAGREPVSTRGDSDSLAPQGTIPLVSDRIQAVRDAVNNPFSLASHKANYVLPIAYRDISEELFAAENRYGMQTVEPAEVQFQLSLQVPLWSGFLGADSFLSAAYTNRSFWQAYAQSGPFREINHEVELLATWTSNWHILGFRNVVSQAGISHQSNGRSGAYSRGWNRVFVDFTFENGGYFVGIKPWYRLSTDPDAGRGPDLDDHFGNFELSGGYRSGGYTSSIKVRNNLSSQNYGAIELNWKFPITTRVRGFVKYFDGYGESLIDYSVRVRTLGIGFELAPGFL
ncbi:phospholipase A [Microbulbifer sp. YPW1]|uniref:phospholipase A n=1 Tax=Microbulbifer sp. YPW1 TaxID=2745199 RepID=UPI0015989DE5|nr:phospholipase A [Microbulbifer sp. YPW1]QKX18780.1 phospholipase A [Microbulbifer sp. YPW1]